jgi:uncharacterized protein YcfJ
VERASEGHCIMLKKVFLSTALAASSLVLVPTAAQAQSQGYYGRGYSYNDAYGNDGRRYATRSDPRYARGHYNHSYGRRCSGTTGTILGAVAGALLGRQIGRRGSSTTGTIIGGAAGALGGRAIHREICRR